MSFIRSAGTPFFSPFFMAQNDPGNDRTEQHENRAQQERHARKIEGAASVVKYSKRLFMIRGPMIVVRLIRLVRVPCRAPVHSRALFRPGSTAAPDRQSRPGNRAKGIQTSSSPRWQKQKGPVRVYIITVRNRLIFIAEPGIDHPGESGLNGPNQESHSRQG